ncbi:hypothetical protein AB0M28_05910 [Streptomyces sp. NPDC051940]|uniref:hypothetical protein n=1 Tax=Streptomyces sp. NPDC051940 TaxID=3155675 RepID=UPI00341E9F98
MRHARRIRGAAAAGLVVAIAMGMSGAVQASATGNSAKPGATTAADKDGTGKESDWLAGLAQRYGVSVEALEQVLIQVKQALGENGGDRKDPALLTLVARELGISEAKAADLLSEVFGASGPEDGKGDKAGKGKKGDKKGKAGPQITPARFIQALAEELDITRAQATATMHALDRLGRDHGVDPDSPEFAAIARGLGITPERLEDALRAVKIRLAGDGKEEAKPGTKGEEKPGPTDEKSGSPAPYTS